MSCTCLFVFNKCIQLFFPGSRFKRFKNQMSNSFDKTLLRDSGFLLAIACHFFFHLAFFVPGGFLPNSALSYGIRKDYVPWLMSIIGLTSFIGRPVAGFLGVLFHKKIVILFGLYLVFFSLSMITMLWRTFPLLVLASALFGFTSGMYYFILTVNPYYRKPTRKYTPQPM